MTIDGIREVMYGLVAEFFQGATVIFANQLNTRPEPPCVTIKTGDIDRTTFPVEDEDGKRYYPCDTTLEINLYTRGRKVSGGDNETGNYSNTAAADLSEFFDFLEGEHATNVLARNSMSVMLRPPVRDLTDLQNDSKYRYRAMAEATLSYAQEADGPYGMGGKLAPNASGGGTQEMVDAKTEEVESVEIEYGQNEGGSEG